MKSLSGDHVSRHIDANPQVLYDLVSDVTRTPQWSPEVISCHWVGEATPGTVGARFTARNKRRWLTWANKPEVVVAEPGHVWAVSRKEPGAGTLVWRYDFTPSGSGTSVDQSFEVTRKVPIAFHWLLRVLFGVRDLQEDLHRNMETSLGRLAGIAQRESAGAPSA